MGLARSVSGMDLCPELNALSGHPGQQELLSTPQMTAHNRQLAKFSEIFGLSPVSGTQENPSLTARDHYIYL